MEVTKKKIGWIWWCELITLALGKSKQRIRSSRPAYLKEQRVQGGGVIVEE